MNNWPMPDRHVPHGFGPMLPNEAGFFCKFWIPFSPSAHPLPVTASKRRATVFLRTGCSWSHACFVTSVPAAFKQNLPFQNVFPARTHAPKASPPALCLAYHHPYIRSLKPSLPLLLPFKQEIRSFFSFLTVHFRYQPEQPPWSVMLQLLPVHLTTAFNGWKLLMTTCLKNAITVPTSAALFFPDFPPISAKYFLLFQRNVSFPFHSLLSAISTTVLIRHLLQGRLFYPKPLTTECAWTVSR